MEKKSTLKKIIILGGGLSGLAAGEILSRNPNLKVIILEKDSDLGGLASSFYSPEEQAWIPKYYHHVIKTNYYTQSYLKRFNLFHPQKWQRIRILIGLNQRFYEINKVSGLLKFSPLSFFGKIRFGLFGLYTLLIMNPKYISTKMNAKSWLNKYAGKEVTSKIFQELYARNKFNMDLEKISAKQLANRLKEKEIYDLFTYPHKSFNDLIEHLKEEILARNGEIFSQVNIKQINHPVREIILSEEKSKISEGNKIKYDLLINTIPNPEFLKISTGLPLSFTKKISQVRYCPAVGLVFATKKFLKDKVYWINLFQERVHVIMQHSILADPQNKRYKNKINWCIRYGGSEEDLYKPDSEIKKIYLDTIGRYFPKAEIMWSKVFREKYAEPIYDINYAKYKPEYQTPLPELYMAGIQVTFPKIRNMNVALESGVKVAHLINNNLKSNKKLEK